MPRKNKDRRPVDPASATTEAAAYGAAIRLLGRRGHSRRELSHKLRQRGYEAALIETVLVRCERNNYLDDAANCEHYCRELIRKGQGPRAIRQRLVHRGFDSKLIETTLETQYSAPIIQATARAVAVRKMGQLKRRYRETNELRARLFRFLVQRGFPSDVVHAAINHALTECIEF